MNRTYTRASRLRIAARFNEIADDIARYRDTNWERRAAYFRQRADHHTRAAGLTPTEPLPYAALAALHRLDRALNL